MTNQVAIRLLNQIRHMLLNSNSWLPETHNPVNEAFDMAISALQAQDLQSTCNNLATDTISRQAAIDALLEEVRLVDGYYVENDEVIDKDDAIEAIRLLPSVTLKPDHSGDTTEMVEYDDCISRQAVADVAYEVGNLFDGEDDTRTPYGVAFDIQMAVDKLPSVTPKLSNIDFLMPESELVFYDNDHGFCINTQDVLEHIERYAQWKR